MRTAPSTRSAAIPEPAGRADPSDRARRFEGGEQNRISEIATSCASAATVGTDGSVAPGFGGAPIGVEIRVRGRVQGVGFRPTVWRLATELGLDGEVLNDAAGVLIRACGGAGLIDSLVERLAREPPPLARIDHIERVPLKGPVSVGFRIVRSGGGRPQTEIAPDAKLCAACAAEISTPGETRYRYAFTSCTDCGPRLSIVEAIPYDRAMTTMAEFPLCTACATEYRDPSDRRFHVEPIACPACGPQLAFLRLPELSPIEGDPIDRAAAVIRAGAIVAIKGLGGYQLACDAGNPGAVLRLRRRKRRDRKPFALMARDLAGVRRYCTVGAAEAEALSATAGPIVLLPANGPERLPEAVAPGLTTLGFMLPTTPLHLLLMAALDRAAVMTSGNLSEEPQVTEDAEMMERLGGIADYALTHNRAVANRIDDSVAHVAAGHLRLIRRARGYAPAPISLPPGFERTPEILAMGGELKASFCLVKGGQAILSQHQGDIENAAAFDDYRKNLALYRALFDHRPAALAADRHPEYLSAKLARDRARSSGERLIEVQHHHAHFAACLAENGRPLDAPPVLGIVMDGLGWGDDGTIWGGEFLLGGFRCYRRLASLAPVAMPGGRQAVREPWRNLYAQLLRVVNWAELRDGFGGLDIFTHLARKPLAALDAMIAKGLNSPPASSCGRLFDAVAAALGICWDRQAYEGEAAMRLEAIVDRDALRCDAGYRFEISSEMIDPLPLWPALIDDLATGVTAGVIAARFHAGLAEALAEMAERLLKPRGLDTVALSGGCFQNRFLLEETLRRCADRDLIALSHAAVPSNDGGLAFGQAMVAAAQLIEGARPCA